MKGGERTKNKKKAFMDLYSMLLCFHLQSSSKMKESEHKKSTHEIILNFNKTRRKSIGSESAGWGMFRDSSRDHLRVEISSLRINIHAPSDRMFFTHFDCDAFYISRDFHVH